MNLVLLSHNHLIHAVHEIGDKGTLLLDANIQFADVYSFCHNYLCI